ncbi:hypothetical protein [Candidatus Syntrophosphaera thermopropionivorans]|uniref:Uncharacterized protein n=1 Tax=Candidatus Syntrophosphaera thermopropionivorans TaxID=2593015 RepID=A0AC61QKU2_9BACT|nr:hypothetical protein [Candidatus Syntrophosphaera thermopropionivorans]TDF74515.1 hypothetical protein E0946_00050 [Candidatus Syntrophosphaera thermopropionivorans]
MTSPNRVLSLLLLSVLLLLTSCWNPFRPRMEDHSDTTIQNRTPQEVLENLELSYKERNINIYQELLSEDFRFELISSEVNQIGVDVNNDGLRDDWWGYDQEILYTKNLFTTGSSDGSMPPPDELQLHLQIPPESSWEIDPQVGHEDWVIIPCMFDLKLSYYASNSMITASGVARFYLKPMNNRWYLAIWRDESNL